MWNNFSQLAQGLREQATAAVHNAGLDEQLVSAVQPRHSVSKASGEII